MPALSGTTMTEQDAVVRACEQLSIAYARAVDFRDYDTLVRLFTEDGVLDVTGTPLQGRAAIAKAIFSRPDELRSRHVLTNIFIDVLGADEARGISYLTLYRHVGPESLTGAPAPLDGPAAVGHYEDRFARTPEGWRFVRRQLHLAFRRV
jgi:ketosteroid isomerase-like protein